MTSATTRSATQSSKSRSFVDIVQPDLSMCGGLRAGREIALLARLHHVRPMCGELELAWRLIEYDVGDNALRDTIFKEPIVVEDGACVLPNRPGLGVEFDPVAVRRFSEP